MGVFGASGQARTFDVQVGDVGYVPFASGHYIENTGVTPVRFLEVFKSGAHADVSLHQWMALTPPELVEAHLHLGPEVMEALRKGKTPVVFRSKIGVYPSSPSKNLKGCNLVMERSCPAGVYRESRIADLVECGMRHVGAGK
jgi:cupin